MPARRLVVAAASGLVFLTVLASAPVEARTTTTQRRRTTTTEQPQRRTTTTTTRRAEATTTTRRAPATTTTARQASSTTSTAAPAAARAGSTTTSTVAARVSTERYVVVLKKGNRAATVADEHKRTRRVKVQRLFGHAVRGYAADIEADEVDEIRKDKRVLYVEKAKQFRTFAQALPWGVERVSRRGTDWSSTRPGDGTGTVGPGLNVYVIDTGIAPHPDLNGGTVVNVKGGVNTDCHGHGTHMGGIVGAIDNASGVVGVAPGVRLNGIKAFDCAGRGTDLDALAGLEWVIGNGTRPSVITMSFGGAISRAFDDGVRRAVNAGFLVVVAAGNESRNACNFSPAHMGELPGVITVGGSTNRDGIAAFSNRGPCVDIYAPGTRITSTWPGGGLTTASGTSVAAPHVAGVAALYLFGPGSDAPADAEAIIKSNAVRVGTRRNVLRVSAHAF